MGYERPRPTAETLAEGKRLRALREAKGISQRQLAAMAGVQQGFISKMECGFRSLGLRVGAGLDCADLMDILEGRPLQKKDRKQEACTEAAELGAELRRKRLAAGFRLRDIARRTGFTSSYVKYAEAGRSANPGTVRKMLRAVDELSKLDPGDEFFEKHTDTFLIKKGVICWPIRHWEFTPGRVYVIRRDTTYPSETGRNFNTIETQWERARKAEYITTTGINHVFRIRNGGYITCFTDQQLIGMCVEAVR